MEYPFACEICGSVGTALPLPSVGGAPAVGGARVVIGLDPECDGCQSIAQEAAVAFPPRFGPSPLDHW